MAETLSQSQIDELLNRMRSGDVDDAPKPEENPDKIKEYDFSLPKKFTRDQLKMLRSLNETFSRQLSSYFTSTLRDVCEVSISQIEEQRYGEFSNSLPENVLVGLLSCTPTSKDFDEMPLLLEFTSSFGFYLVERMLGGSGVPVMPEREYTDVELTLLHSVLQKITDDLQIAWNNFFESDIRLQEIETNGKMLQTFSPQDIIVILTMEIKSPLADSTANLCIPANNLEEIINSLGIKYMYNERQTDTEKIKMRRDALFTSLQPGKLEMTAYLDHFQMTLQDILRLQVNDVVQLNQRIDEDVRVDVDGKPWFSARLGEVEEHKALKLVDSKK
ncbi:MAG: flagellar motor switch protein FliM [Faecalibacterium sp.]|jgi:flagellar motor switch protein FliM|nr:flagellar motor switch protein FliM [Faecalibacterium sp.]